MSRRIHTEIIVECDICNERKEESAPTQMRLDRLEREGDFCENCKTKLREAMTPFLEVGRKPEAAAKPASRRGNGQNTKVMLECRKGCGRMLQGYPGRGAHERACTHVAGEVEETIVLPDDDGRYHCTVEGCDKTFQQDYNRKRHERAVHELVAA